MKKVRYVRLNPTGNLTCLVLDPVAEAERPQVTAALMNRCEQVGYLMPAEAPGAAARLQMMGGEFCGNAAMATAAWLTAENAGAAERENGTELLLEVSGAEEPVRCGIRREPDGWRGRVQMPLPREAFAAEISGRRLQAVRFPGMLHLVSGGALSRPEAEELMEAAKNRFPDAAIGLMQWCGGRLTPLVWVRESGTQVWETACGSGTAAAACAESLRRGGPVRISASQPGGILEAETEWNEKKLSRIWLSGKVTWETPEEI